MQNESPLFLGLDGGTQSLKAVVIDSAGAPVCERSLTYDNELPAYGTHGGVHRGSDGLTVTAPPLMWADALDALLSRLRADGAPMDRIAAVSGSAQQHGSVFLRAGLARRFRRLDPGRRLALQLEGLFAVSESPTWMDGSTSRQCRQRDAALGGPQAVAELTGSRSTERFTGNQIAKLFQKRPEAYRRTARIALVSSFFASLLIGDNAPLEPGDGAGMNLMDIRAQRWAPEALACTAPGLARKLGPLVPSHMDIGPIAPYFVARHGFSPRARVIAFSGDNPNSLAALRLERPGDVAVSLGTSDTIFGALARPIPSAVEGHIFGNPIEPRGFMALLCFQNGSRTREAAREAFAGGAWARFNRALRSTPPGNGGRLGFFFTDPEITPPIQAPGSYWFDADDRPVPAFPNAAAVRAVVEGQFLSLRRHSGALGLVPRKLLATGGASVNPYLLQILADVFGVPVHVGSVPASAALGAALRALHGWRCAQARAFIPFARAVRPATGVAKACDPIPAHHRIYDALQPRAARLERRLAGNG